jgi:glucose-6-phosphate isomerase
MQTTPGPRTSTWADLASHASRLGGVATPELFSRDPGRFERFSRQATGLQMDFSRQRIDEVVLAKLTELVDAVGLRERIDAMWRGDRINRTEDRAVLHVALRQPAGAAVGGAEIEKQVMTERERMLSFAEAVRAGRIKGSAGKPFSLVITSASAGRTSVLPWPCRLSNNSPRVVRAASLFPTWTATISTMSSRQPIRPRRSSSSPRRHSSPWRH